MLVGSLTAPSSFIDCALESQCGVEGAGALAGGRGNGGVGAEDSRRVGLALESPERDGAQA